MSLWISWDINELNALIEKVETAFDRVSETTQHTANHLVDMFNKELMEFLCFPFESF